MSKTSRLDALKSNVHDNEIPKGDLARSRLQLGAQFLALRHESARLKETFPVPARGMLVFSKPNGLAPHAPRIKDIGGDVEAIRISIGPSCGTAGASKGCGPAPILTPSSTTRTPIFKTRA